MDLTNIPLDTNNCPRVTSQPIDRLPEIGEVIYLKRFHHGHQCEIYESFEITGKFGDSKCFVCVNGDRSIMIGWNNGLTGEFEYNPLLFWQSRTEF